MTSAETLFPRKVAFASAVGSELRYVSFGRHSPTPGRPCKSGLGPSESWWCRSLGPCDLKVQIQGVGRPSSERRDFFGELSLFTTWDKGGKAELLRRRSRPRHVRWVVTDSCLLSGTFASALQLTPDTAAGEAGRRAAPVRNGWCSEPVGNQRPCHSTARKTVPAGGMDMTVTRGTASVKR